MSGCRVRREDVVAISALTGEGVDALGRTISERLSVGSRVHSARVAASDGAAIAWLHRHGEVLAQREDGEHIEIDVRMSEKDWDRFRAR